MSTSTRSIAPAFITFTGWFAVTSTNVAKIRWGLPRGQAERPDTLGWLEVLFLNGGHYRYYDVQRSTFDNMRFAESKGRFVWTHLRDKYAFDTLAKGVSKKHVRSLQHKHDRRRKRQ